jgi:hypothetical protein
VTGLLRSLRVEDLILAAWLGLVAPGTDALIGPEVSEGPIAGLVIVVATLMAIACLATRPPDQPRVRVTDEGQDAPRWIIAGPLVGAVALVSSTGFEHLGIGFDLGGVVLLGAVAAIVANHWLPVLAPEWRRLLVLPFTLVAGSFFASFAADVLEGLDPSDLLGSIGMPDPTFAAFVVLMIVGGLAAFYAMLVVAPRQLADPEDAGFRWVVRFALFLVASLFGIGWLGALG